MTKMTCLCKDFYVNMRELDCAVDVAYVHSFSLSNEFAYFRYCPWCGNKLLKKITSDDESKEKHEN